MSTIVSFPVTVADHEHTIRAEVEQVGGEHLVLWCDLAHVRDLVDTHGLTSVDLERFEAKAIEAWKLQSMAGAVRERLSA